jgi:hypothetical protein
VEVPRGSSGHGRDRIRSAAALPSAATIPAPTSVATGRPLSPPLPPDVGVSSTSPGSATVDGLSSPDGVAVAAAARVDAGGVVTAVELGCDAGAAVLRVPAGDGGTVAEALAPALAAGGLVVRAGVGRELAVAGFGLSTCRPHSGAGGLPSMAHSRPELL